MKKFTIFLIAGFILLSNSLFSQISFTPYLASEQLDAAKNEVTKKYTDPQLISVATLNGVLPTPTMGDVPITFTYDNSADKGKASAWVYVFRSASAPENIQALVVAVVPIMGTMVFNLTDMQIELGSLTKFVSANNLEGKTWINSDVLVDKLLGAAQYQAFLTQYPNAIPKYINLGYADYPPLNANTPYWAVQVNNAETDSTVIIINALDGTVLGVTDENVYPALVNYPNPATDFITFEIPAEFAGIKANVNIYDNAGRSVQNSTAILNGLYILNTKNLNSGNYIITFSNSSRKSSSSFVISK